MQFTFRCYAGPLTTEIYSPLIKELLSVYPQIEFLGPVITNSLLQFEKVTKSDYSIIFLSDSETTREEKINWYSRTVTPIVNNTKIRTLAITFSRIYPIIAKQRKEEYENAIPNIDVEYVDWIEAIPDKPLISQIIRSFIQRVLFDQ